MIYTLLAILSVCALTRGGVYWFLARNKGQPDGFMGTPSGWGLDVHIGLVWLISSLLSCVVVVSVMLATCWLARNQSRLGLYARRMPCFLFLFAVLALAFGFISFIGTECSYA